MNLDETTARTLATPQAFAPARTRGAAPLSETLAHTRDTSGAPAPLSETLAHDTPGAASPSPLPPAPRLGRYVVVRHLGSGGMGSVHVAYDEELHRRVAVKLLHDIGDDAEARARMLREAQALARLSHPNVVQIHDIGEHDGRIFMAMEYVEGATLRAWRDDTRPDLDAIRERYLQAGRGLAAAHAAGIAHRDFKADNAVLGSDGRVRVLDFGLARADTCAPELPVPEAMSSSFRAELTHLGALVGTPAYMSPEQLRGRTADARSDQFSFCAALFEAFYGARPFAGDTLDELRLAVAAGRVRDPPPGVELPPRLHQALLRGLAPDPAARWPGMPELLAELAVDLRSDPSGSPRLRRRLIAAWVVVFVLIQAVVLSRGLIRAEPPTPLAHRDEGLIVWTLLVAAWLALRPLLRDHPHHRAIYNTFMVAVTGMTLARVLLHHAGAALRPMIVADLMIMAVIMALGALFLARWMTAAAVLSVALAAAVALLPAGSVHLFPAVYPALDIVLLAAWAHASRPRPPRPAAPPG